MKIFNEQVVAIIEKEIKSQKASGKTVTREMLLNALGLPNDHMWANLISQIIYFQSTKFELARKAGFIVTEGKKVIEFPDIKIEEEDIEPAPETLKSTPFSIKPPEVSEQAPVVEIASSPMAAVKPEEVVAPEVVAEVAPEISREDVRRVKDQQRENMRRINPETGLPKWMEEEVKPNEGIMVRDAKK
jgi:hypothetical protein